MVFCLNQNIPEVWNSVKKYNVNRIIIEDQNNSFFLITSTDIQL